MSSQSDYSPYLNQQDVQGFQSKLYQTEQIFGELKSYDFPSQLFNNEQIRQLVVSPNQVAILTFSHKVYRITNKKGVWQKLDIPDRIEQSPAQQQQQQQNAQNQGNLITNLFSNVVSGVGSVVSGVGYVVSGVGQILNITDGAQTILIDKLFLDPFGYHLIACSNQGYSFYINYHHDNQMRMLKNVRGEEYVITSIGWEESQGAQKDKKIEYEAKSFILGTSKGVLYIYRITVSQTTGEVEETNPFMALELHGSSQSKAIVAIRYLKIFNDNRKERKFLVLVSTNTSLYAFSDKDIALHLSTFKQYEQQSKVCINIKDIDSSSEFRTMQSSLLSVCNVFEGVEKDRKKIPNSILWVNECGLFNSSIPTCYEQYRPGFLKELKKFTYGKQQEERNSRIDPTVVQEMPVDILLTEFHYILLYQDNLTIMSKINEKIVASYDLRNMGVILGLQYDFLNKIIWIYSSREIKYFSIQNEEKDGWRLYLEMKQYNMAYESAKKANVSPTDLAYLAGLYGQQQFSKKDYKKAAQLYFETNLTFEEVTMKFLNQQQKGDIYAVNGLEEYLTLWLKNLKQDVRTQKHLLIYWLIEIKAEKINAQELILSYHQQYAVTKFKSQKDKDDTLDRINYEITKQKKGLSTLIENYCYDRDIDENAIYQILQTHGRIEDSFDYAWKKGSYEVIIKHYFNEDAFAKVIQTINAIPFDKERQRNDLLVKYSYILIQKQPDLFIQKLKDYSIKPYKKESKVNKRQQSQILDSRENKLVRALIDIPSKDKAQGVLYLKDLIYNIECDDKYINNMLILFLSQMDDEGSLEEYFLKQETIKKDWERCNFSFEFAFTIAKSYQLFFILVQLYGLKDMCSEAIKIALENGEEMLVDKYIRQPNNENEQRKLLLQTAKFYLQSNNIIKVIELLRENPLLHVEQILPDIQESAQVSEVTQQISFGLEKKNEQIQELRKQIRVYSSAADKIKQDLNKISKYVIIKQDKTCRICNRPLFTDRFYIFPCKHGFHKNCLILKVIENGVDQMKLDKINNLNKKIEEIEKNIETLNSRKRASSDDIDIGLFNNPLNKLVNFVAMHAIEEDNDENATQIASYQKELNQHRTQLDQELALECIECGPNIIESIYKKPFNDNIKIANDWKL